MTNLRIEICKNFRGKYNIRIGDIEGCSESSNLTFEEVMNELKTEIQEVFKFEGVSSIEKGCGELRPFSRPSWGVIRCGEGGYLCYKCENDRLEAKREDKA